MPLSVIGADLALSFYARLAPRGAAVLVLGAGEGELACALARRGHPVVGVEPSARLLAAAIERREREVPQAALRLVNADLRTERLGTSFPLVLAPHNALGLAGDEAGARALLSGVAAHLTPDGVFALDARVGPARAEAWTPASPHLRGRSEGRRALHRLARFMLSTERLDALLLDAGLEARERYRDFQETPGDADAELQVVVGGRR
jgi:SAM-dependent methyltransferase